MELELEELLEGERGDVLRFHYGSVEVTSAAEWLELSGRGVRACCDWTNESHFVEVEKVHSNEDFQFISGFLDGMGLEDMPEEECAPVELDNGATVHWLAERFEV